MSNGFSIRVASRWQAMHMASADAMYAVTGITLVHLFASKRILKNVCRGLP